MAAKLAASGIAALASETADSSLVVVAVAATSHSWTVVVRPDVFTVLVACAVVDVRAAETGGADLDGYDNDDDDNGDDDSSYGHCD